jgi:hypothetical protein
VLELAREVDRTTFRLVEGLIHLRAHGIAETTIGVSLDRWLAAIGRRTHADRRMLVTTADLCRRLPALRAGSARLQGRGLWTTWSPHVVSS